MPGAKLARCASASAALAFALLLSTSTAQARPKSFNLNRVGIAAGVEGGSVSTEGRGVSAGYTLPFGLHAGGHYHWRDGGVVCALTCIRSEAWEWSGRVGWDFGTNLIALRPFLSLGALGFESTGDGCSPPSRCKRSSEFALGMGGQMLVPLGIPYIAVVATLRLVRNMEKSENATDGMWSLGLGAQL